MLRINIIPDTDCHRSNTWQYHLNISHHYLAHPNVVANQHVMISHQYVEAISTTKQEAKWKQSGSKVEAKWKQSGSKVEAKAWNMLEGMVLQMRH
jgi:hypothetical protein